MPTPTLTIDLVPIALVLSALISAVCLVVMLRFRGGPHLTLWATGGILVALATLLIVLRGIIPDLASVLAANLGAIAGYVCLTVGTHAYIGRGSRLVAAFGFACAAAFIAGYWAGVGLPGRVALISVPIMTFSVLIAMGFGHAARRGAGAVAWIALIVASANAMLSAARLLVSLKLLPGVDDAPILHSGVLGLGVLAAAGIAIALAVISVRTFTRRTFAASIEADQPPPFTETTSGWHLVQARCELATPKGSNLRLTGNEYLVLQQLFDSPGRPVSRAVLNALIGRETGNPKDRSIDILISRLRRKCLETGADLPITSVRGRGYVFHAAVLA